MKYMCNLEKSISMALELGIYKSTLPLNWGVEIEYHLSKNNGHLNKKDFIEILKKINHESKKFVTEDCLLIVIGSHYVKIKPDFCYSIIEVEFSFFQNYKDMRKVFALILNQLFYACRANNIEISSKTFMEKTGVPDLVNSPYVKRSVRNLRIHNKDMYFASRIISTHIHVNRLNLDSCTQLKEISEFSKNTLSCDELDSLKLRNDLYEKNLNVNYKELQNKEYKDVSEYVNILKKDNIFNSKSQTIWKDMSNVRMTKHGTIEFRINRSTSNFEELILYIEHKKHVLKKFNLLGEVTIQRKAS